MVRRLGVCRIMDSVLEIDASGLCSRTGSLDVWDT